MAQGGRKQRSEEVEMRIIGGLLVWLTLFLWLLFRGGMIW